MCYIFRRKIDLSFTIIAGPFTLTGIKFLSKVSQDLSPSTVDFVFTKHNHLSEIVALSFFLSLISVTLVNQKINGLLVRIGKKVYLSKAYHLCQLCQFLDNNLLNFVED